MEAALAFIILGVAAPLFIFCVVYVVKKKTGERRALWQRLASQQGGRALLGDGLFYASKDQLVLPCRGFEVTLDFYEVSHEEESATVYQRTRAQLRGEDEMSAKIYKETPLFSSIGKALGGQDVRIGDDSFDQAFIIKCDDPARITRKLRGHEVLREHLSHAQLRVELEDGELTVTVAGLSDRAEEILAQVRVTALYAQALSAPPQLGAMRDGIQRAW